MAIGFTVGCSADRLPSPPQPGKGVGPRVPPHVAAVAPEPTKLDVVLVAVAAVFEDEDKLMLTAIQRTHTAIVLDPNTEVLQLAIYAATGG